MRKEIKICLPFYKIAYSVFFIVVLSLIRGMNFTFEIGVVLEPQMALLAAVFCADTYVQEIVSKRSEIARLYPMKKRMASIFRRMGVQEIYLLILAVVGYGMFFVFQNPVPFYVEESGTGVEAGLFWVYLSAVIITLVFWGILSVTLSCLFRNIWVGIGGCLILWIITNSTIGKGLLGKWNLFSYTFRNIEDSKDISWICGKILCMGLGLIMMAVLPQIIKKRG